jgi:hypothetical protein
MNPVPDELELRIEGFLRGELGPEEMQLFQRELDHNPELRDQVQQQRRIDGWLRRAFEPMTVPLPAPRALAFKPGGARPLRRLWWYGAAAAILLAGAGVFVRFVNNRFADPRISPDSLYNRLVMRGFQPTTVCTTEKEFAAFVRQRFGQALSAAAAPAVEILGWGYGDQYDGSPLSPKALILLARVEGQPVTVLIDRVSADRELTVPEHSPLHLFKRTMGRLVVYEITPADAPRVLDSLFIPDK